LPLRCCKVPVPEDTVTAFARRHLNFKDSSKLLSAIEENACTDKMYCPEPKCSAFIDLNKVIQFLDKDMNFYCPNKNCRTQICYKCKSTKHNASRLCEETTQESVIETELKAFGYQRCTKCRHYVELKDGCNHITCICSHQFCYECGMDWTPRKKCHCPLYDEARIRREVDVLIPANIRGPERQQRLYYEVRAEQQRMVAEEECEHDMERTDEYQDRSNKPRCRLCQRRLNLFGFVCRAGCGQKLCIGCHLNR